MELTITIETVIEIVWARREDVVHEPSAGHVVRHRSSRRLKRDSIRLVVPYVACRKHPAIAKINIVTRGRQIIKARIAVRPTWKRVRTRCDIRDRIRYVAYHQRSCRRRQGQNQARCENKAGFARVPTRPRSLTSEFSTRHGLIVNR